MYPLRVFPNYLVKYNTLKGILIQQVGSGTTLQTHYLVYAVFNKLINKSSLNKKMDTKWCFWRKLCWSFQALLDGEMPYADADGVEYLPGTPEAELAGTKLAGGEFCGVLWLISGDLEYMYKELKVEYYNSNDPCFYCGCDCDDASIPWKDLRPTAEWTKHIYTNFEAWLASHPLVNEVFLLEWVTILSVVADLMHCKHLGVDMNLAGAVLWLFCFGGFIDGS